jgi:hypothetical protein
LARIVVGSGLALALIAVQANLSMDDSLAVAQPAPTPVPCTLPPHGVVVQIGTPAPFAVLQSNSPVTVSGVAYDTTASGVPGIASVSVFLGDRDKGGISLGNASIGQTVPGQPSGTAMSTAGFSLRTSNIPQGTGSRDLFVYAKSSVSNTEGSSSVPIYLNAAPTVGRGQVPTPVLPPPPVCTPTPAPTSTPAATPTTPPAPATATPVPVAPLAATPTAVPTPALLPPAPIPAAPAPASPPAAAPAPAAAAPAAAMATQPTAPRGGGIPAAFGLVIVGAGAAVAGVGVVLRRRQRKP